METKTIRLQSMNGYPVIGAHVLNLDGSGSTITNLDGVAIIKASPSHKIKITHVGGASKQFLFSELPSVVILEANELDEVIVTAKPRSAGIGVLGVLVGLGLLYLIFKNHNA